MGPPRTVEDAALIATFEAAIAEGKGVVTHNGRMIENLHVDNARRIWPSPTPSPPAERAGSRRRSGPRPTGVGDSRPRRAVTERRPEGDDPRPTIPLAPAGFAEPPSSFAGPSPRPWPRLRHRRADPERPPIPSSSIVPLVLAIVAVALRALRASRVC
ncbi:MAG: hypothetical protein R2711_10240 [Acidimicrobiales bacterium]